MLATIFAITEAGPGPISLDRKLGTERCGTPWAIAQVAAGAVAAEAIERLARSSSSPDAAEPDRQASPQAAEAPVHAPA